MQTPFYLGAGCMGYAGVRQPGLEDLHPESTWESDLRRKGGPTLRRHGVRFYP